MAKIQEIHDKNFEKLIRDNFSELPKQSKIFEIELRTKSKKIGMAKYHP